MSLVENLKPIQQAISAAPQKTDLIAVSKRQPPEKLVEALKAGLRIFGENRVQEAYEHWHDFKQRGEYPDLCLHLIGPLQTNKVKEAVALFDVIQSVDREKLAHKLADEMEKQDRSLPCYIQVNTGEEPQKAGVIPAELPDFLAFCRKTCGLNIVGLMCIPPVEDPPAVHFAFLARLAAQHGLKKLSMGMSDDYDKALALGATDIRIGSALFGARL